jgi:hypothetical protein
MMIMFLLQTHGWSFPDLLPTASEVSGSVVGAVVGSGHHSSVASKRRTGINGGDSPSNRTSDGDYDGNNNNNSSSTTTTSSSSTSTNASKSCDDESDLEAEKLVVDPGRSSARCHLLSFIGSYFSIF